jgi:hypothetical protein
MVVVEDRSNPPRIADQGVIAWAAQVDEECLVGLQGIVAVDEDRDGLGRLPGQERHDPVLCLVVAAGSSRAAGDRGVIDSHRLIRIKGHRTFRPVPRTNGAFDEPLDMIGLHGRPEHKSGTIRV